MVVHACNKSHSGGNDQENLGLRSTRQSVSETPISIYKLGMDRCVPGMSVNPATRNYG
jgi:hypothetical protein